MSAVTISYSMTAASSLLLALICGFTWWRKPEAKAYLLFVGAALGMAASAGFELAMLRADTPAQFATALRWGHVAIWVLFVSLAGFVWLYLRAGRPWLLGTICALRTAALALNFLTGENLHYREVVRLRQVRLLGETVSLGVGSANPWMLVGQLSTLGLVVFVLDASITAWRRGEQRAALIVGGSIILFSLAAVCETGAVFWGLVSWPIIFSWFFWGIVVAMSYELTSDASRVSKLAAEVCARDRLLVVTGEAASTAAQQHRAELAHLSRTASLGEMTPALIHELAQPLTSILSNAQSAEVLLSRAQWDAQELRDIVRDIISDNNRATNIIRGLRSFLSKGEFQHQVLAPNGLVQDVIKLTRPEMSSHSIQVITILTPDLPFIRGDRVQLQQVLINLILNARDAMTNVDRRARSLTITSQSSASHFIEISIADTGRGFPPGAEEKIFEPYYTTKQLGLGLGLSLSRSIVGAHGGRLWAEKCPSGGVIVHCVLPQWTAESKAPP
jgi:signal transduction histidine kinase